MFFFVRHTSVGRVGIPVGHAQGVYNASRPSACSPTLPFTTEYFSSLEAKLTLYHSSPAYNRLCIPLISHEWSILTTNHTTSS